LRHAARNGWSWNLRLGFELWIVPFNPGQFDDSGSFDNRSALPTDGWRW
jgi:hypothetical protein